MSIRFATFPLFLFIAPLLSANFFLEGYSTIKPAAINESSGIVKSRQFEGVYWTHNDSGDTNRIFAIDKNGEPIQTEWSAKQGGPYEGIVIGEATNIDWEDIATDDKGNLLIAACGNNDNARRDLAIYVFPEPDPKLVWKTRAQKRIDFHYPDQQEFPDPKDMNFDCEALFFANGKPYLVSKNRSEAPAKLYRLDEQKTGVSNPATLVSRFPLGGQVTGADATPDGSSLAILTYTGLWVFDAPEGSDDYFSGTAHFRPFIAKQCEAVCWDENENLVITNEQGDLYLLERESIPEFVLPSSSSN